MFKKDPFVIAHNTGISLEETNPDAFSALTAKSSPNIPAVYLVAILLITTTSSISAAISSSSAKIPDAIIYFMFSFSLKNSIVRVHDTVAAASSYLGVVLL